MHVNPELKNNAALIDSVLDLLETKESHLLGWGVTDFSFSESELSDLIYEILEWANNEGLTEITNPDDVIKLMLEAGLLIKAHISAVQFGYRTRSAEAIRLLQRLRQLFDKHRNGNDWQKAPTLVADFRYNRRKRAYPKRNIEWNEVEAELSKLKQHEIASQVFQKMLADDLGNLKKLSGFQLRASMRVLELVQQGHKGGTIVTSGTGSGKTMAFYLPAISTVAKLIVENPRKAWVKSISLYPRNELLKDQLREVLSKAKSVGSIQGSRPIRVGALFHEVVDQPSHVSGKHSKWRRTGNDFICPFLTCLECKGVLVWPGQTLSKEIEELVCLECSAKIGGDRLALTRKSMQNSPPDMLIVTTEMLNQRLGDNSMNHLFGIGSKAHKPPELVLIDEIHTYEGSHGAHVAFLMRRWQKDLSKRLRFVALSATLREAANFFSSITGTYNQYVVEIAPLKEELEHEGAEYLLLLRGDPVSRAALLSSTIQSCMLITRMLDPHDGTGHLHDSPSGGRFGQKTFVFADDLDVINRLYFGLLSAEGWNDRGEDDQNKAPDGGLAHLRKQPHALSLPKYLGGQDWSALETFGHPLTRKVPVGRVSSQDQGVDSDAEIVVATAALEVGFDDPIVGAVVQHKAPRSLAGFLQRRGRAGRTRGVRPWTLVVLSDYGRDRIAYQNYEMLFDPVLKPKHLPLRNRYLLRMQAAMATLEMLSQKIQNSQYSNTWKLLTGPLSASSYAGRHKHQQDLKAVLGDLLSSETGIAEIKDYLKGALFPELRMEEVESDIDALMWESPRPLMTMVLPTALRRLESNWRASGQPCSDNQVSNNPLPEFIPPNLFSDLSVVETQIHFPGTLLEPESMTVFKAMKEFAPGRVSRRFGVRWSGERFWVCPWKHNQDSGVAQEIDVETMGQMVLLGNFNKLNSDGQLEEIPVFRPQTILCYRPDRPVLDSSNAVMRWNCEILSLNRGERFEPPAKSIWTELTPFITFYTHSQQCPVTVRRFSDGSNGQVSFKDGTEETIYSRFAHNQAPCGIGFEQEVDGVALSIHIPDLLSKLQQRETQKLRSLRVSRFLSLLRNGEEHLKQIDNYFLRDWLGQVFLVALTRLAISQNKTLEDSCEALKGPEGPKKLIETLHLVFESQSHFDKDSEEESSPDRLRVELERCLNDSTVINDVLSCSSVLWEPVDNSWKSWLESVYLATLGSAVVKTITDLCPSIDPSDLNLDLGRYGLLSARVSDVAPKEIWITESNPGGNGLIEEFSRRYAEDPRRFYSIIRANVDVGEFELIDQQLRKFLEKTEPRQGSSELSTKVSVFRTADSLDQSQKALSGLREELSKTGLTPFHGFISSLMSRVLRPGTSQETDMAILHALTFWASKEVQLGIEIDLRSICFSLCDDETLDDVFSISGGMVIGDRRAWRLNMLYGLLWPQGGLVRNYGLQSWSKFGNLSVVERLLVRDFLDSERKVVDIEELDWLPKVVEELAGRSLVSIRCSLPNKSLLGKAIHRLIVTPVESGYIKAYARIQGLRRTSDYYEADFDLQES